MKIICAKNQKEIFSVINIRKTVFMLEQNVDVTEELDDLDYEAKHFLLEVDTKYVGTARVYFDNDTALIGRVAILKEHRNKGYATSLINEIIKLIKFSDTKVIKLGSQVQAAEFYKKLGFKICGDIYIDANIEHYPMELILWAYHLSM